MEHITREAPQTILNRESILQVLSLQYTSHYEYKREDQDETNNQKGMEKVKEKT